MILSRRFRYRLLAATAATLMILSGCSVLPQAESLQVYALPESRSNSTLSVPGPDRFAAWSLRIQTPYSSRMLNSSRIVVRPDHSELSVYKGVRWSDPAPIVLRNRLVNAFREQPGITALGSTGAQLPADLELGGDLNHFQVEYHQGQPQVHIQLDAFLVRPADSRIIATRRFSVEQAVNGTEVPDVVLGFGEAADVLADQVVAWVQQHGTGIVKGREQE